MTNLEQSPRIRLVLVDDHPVVRCGLAEMLSDQDDLEVVGQADDGEAAVGVILEHRPDVTLVDLRLPKLSGVEVIRHVRARWAEAKFVVVTTFDGDEDIVRALQAGASAYILKDSFGGEIIEAIRRVHAGQRLIPPDVAQRLAETTSQIPLSPRERDVLALIARGASNKEVAQDLGLSEATVKTYVTKIFFKLGVSDRTAAATVAVQRGLIVI